MTRTKQNLNTPSEFASFGPIHLNNTNLEKSALFWTKIVGMKLRKAAFNVAEFGTDTQTLVVVHETAKTAFKKGYSGLYHFAIHAPNKEEFASMLHRLVVNKYPYSPVDHTMSKSIYLDDPDGINIEFTLETPERLNKVIIEGGLKMEDCEGNIKNASIHLDTKDILKDITNTNVNTLISEGTYIGHIHLYAKNIEDSNAFYKKLGFLEFNYLPQFLYADLGAGGKYQHRIAHNTWHGLNKTVAPKKNAGLRYLQINYKTKEKLTEALNNITHYEEDNGDYWLNDATGNKIRLTNI